MNVEKSGYNNIGNYKPLFPVESLVKLLWSQNIHDVNNDSMLDGGYEFNTLKETFSYITKKLSIDFWVIVEVIKNSRDKSETFIIRETSDNIEFKKDDIESLPLNATQLKFLENNFYNINFIFIDQVQEWKELLDMFNAKGLLIGNKLFLDKEAIIILGRSKNEIIDIKNDNNIDCFKTYEIKDIDNIINLFEYGYISGRADEAVYNYLKATKNRNIEELIIASFHLLKIQDLIRKKRTSFSKKDERNKIDKCNSYVIYSNSFYDEVMSNYIKATLWLTEKGRHNEPQNNTWLISLCNQFPAYGSLKNEKGLENIKINERANKGEFGFYLNNDNNDNWIAVGPECYETIGELINIYRFICSYLKLETIENKNGKEEKKVPIYSDSDYEKSIKSIETYLTE